jgi:Acetyltransferase (GNAT) domain
MIIMRYGVFTVAEAYFERLLETPRVDVVRYRLVASSALLAEVEPQSTVTIDLAQSESAIFNQFRKDTRYEIRRAETKDLVESRLLTSREITEPVFTELARHYRDLVTTKGITPLNLQRLRLLQEQGRLLIGKASLPDGSPLAWHVYLVAHKRARLLYSVSLFRDTQETAQRALVGRANRLLHWHDIIALKKAGLELYDFGGYYLGKTDESKLRINQFKDEFQGVLRTEYNGMLFLGIMGRVAQVGFQTLRLFYRLKSFDFSPRS